MLENKSCITIYGLGKKKAEANESLVHFEIENLVPLVSMF